MQHVTQPVEELERLALHARRLIIEVAHKSGSGHVGCSLSCVDILTALYFHEMTISADDWGNRDLFIMSKAHAAMSLYTILKLKGLIQDSTFWGFYQDGGTLPTHLDRFSAKGIEASTGSLGHGFNMGLGLAYGIKLRGEQRRVFVLIGDGEAQEGSIWEGALFGARLGISNFTAIMDRNNLQGYGRPSEICYFEPIEEKWKAFGWETCRVNGHDFKQILRALATPHNGNPKIIIADTVKGKGVSFMENEMKWHYFIVTDELKARALEDLRR